MVDSYDSGGWLSALREILKTSGPIALIALLLIWFLMTSVNQSLSSVHDEITETKKQMQKAEVNMEAFVARQQTMDQIKIDQNNLMLRILRQMCVNTAEGPVARNGCYESR